MLWGISLVALFLFTLSVFVPWTVGLAPEDLDLSWELVLQWAHLVHADFGRQIVFTYGPWGFALAGHSPQIFPWVVGVWTFFATTFFLAVWKLATFATPNRWLAAAWMFVAIAVGGAAYMQMQDVRLFSMSWLLFLIHFYVDDRPWTPSKLMLSAAMALSCLIKFSMVFMALPVLAAVTIEQLSRRRAPSLLISFLAAYLAFWLEEHQHLSSLLPYLHVSWLIASGYVEGESTNIPTDAVDVTRFLIAALLLLAIAFFLHPRGKDQPRANLLKYLLAAAALLGQLWTMLKAGFVRHDLHEIEATSSLALLSLMYAAALWPQARHWASRAILVLLSIGMLWLARGSANRFGLISTQDFLTGTIRALPERCDFVAQLFQGSPLTNYQQRDLHPAYGTPVPVVQGTVDSYSWGQAQLLVNGLDYDPRPIFQSYMAYSTALARLNADFLRSPRAPHSILFEIQPIDDHYPSQEESLSWPELLARYQPVDATGPRLFLQQSSQPRNFSLIPIQTTSAEMGRWTPVPDSDDPIWVTMKIHLTPVGKLARLFYKTPPLLLGIKTRSGDLESFRLLNDVAEGGFLLSPRTWERMAFASLYSPNWKTETADSQVTELAVSFAQSEKNICFRDQYDITFWRLKYPHFDVSQVPGITDYWNLHDWFSRIQVVHSEEPPKLITGDGGKIVLTASAPCGLIFPIPPGHTKFHFSFGMLDKSYREWGLTDGVDFRVFTVVRIRPDGFDGKLAWSRTLDPAFNRRDRGLQSAEFQLPQSPPPIALFLETIPGLRHYRSWSYWTDLDLH